MGEREHERGAKQIRLMATIAAIFSSDGHKLPDWLIHSFLLTNNLIRGRERG